MILKWKMAAMPADPLPETKKQEEVEPSRGDRWSPLDIYESISYVTYHILHMIRHENGDFTPVYASVDVTLI